MKDVNNIPIYEPVLSRNCCRREEKLIFFYRLKNNRRSASDFISVNTPPKPMEKEKEWQLT
jgi:hypothetical protein